MDLFSVHFGVFCVFLPNIIKIDLCNFELHRFKVGAFLRQSVELWIDNPS